MVDDAPDNGERLVPDGAGPSNDSFEISLDFRKIIISAFIIWQIFAVTIWLLPEKSPRSLVLPLLADYMQFTGCWQLWSMFSPDPATLDAYVSAEITCADGTRRHWDFPRMSRLSYPERYQEERFRKAIENTETPESSRMYPFLARYAAIVNASTDPRKYPMTVELVRHYRYVPPPPWTILPYAAHTIYSQKFTTDPAKKSAA